MSLIARRAGCLFLAYLIGFLLFYIAYIGFSQRQIIRERVLPWPSRAWARIKSYTQEGEPSKALIVASIKSENTTWIHENFPDWERKIYVNDDPKANLTIPGQKGRESTAYLTYLIDHWDNLPDYMVFIHGERYQWHNEDPMYDGIPMLENLRLEYVKEEGFANLRCTTASLGCPDEIRPEPNPEHYYKPHYPFVNRHMVYAQVFSTVFANRTLPEVVGAACCSQFAVTRAKVKERPREDYFRYRDVLQDSHTDTFISGRAFEYLWHIIMGKTYVHCPLASQCFCRMYGLCNLDCDDFSCKGRYVLPPYNEPLPANWPNSGQGEHGYPKYGWWNETS